MKFKITLILCLIILVTQPVQALKVSALYQATVKVSSESTSVRNSAMKKALIKVLVKLTGDRNIAKNNAISTLFQRPQQFVQQFRYQLAAANKNSVDQVQTPTKELWVQFDETTLNDALRNYGLAVWGKERPSILVWLAHEKNDSRRLVSFEESPEYIAILDKKAVARGVILLFPLLDIEDTLRMSVSDVWGDFKEPVLDASDRYHSNVVLTARLTQILPTLWESKWSAYISASGEEMHWTTQGRLAEIVLEEGIDELVDRIALIYVNTDVSRAEIIELVVSGINNLDEYARTVSYFESIQAVSEVQVKQVSANEVMFEIISHTGITDFKQTIALGKTLELVGSDAPLNYRLLAR